EIATALTSLHVTIIQGICITIQALKQIRLIAILLVRTNVNGLTFSLIFILLVGHGQNLKEGFKTW
ncbi:hypothetical protein, partial [Limosilactobacillus gastricus]|uniref:hypothetical protein n=1 Tax=Limosilactobacillus gastricus TaxID=227942 RepID=UPI000AEC0EC2